MNLIKYSISLFLVTSINLASAKDSNLWLKQMPPQARVAAAFGSICNKSKENIELKSISSKYGRVEFHTMQMKDKMMVMKKLDLPSIKAGECFEMAPGENHIMILNVKSQASAGDKINFLLVFSNNQKQNITATVRKIN